MEPTGRAGRRDDPREGLSAMGHRCPDARAAHAMEDGGATSEAKTSRRRLHIRSVSNFLHSILHFVSRCGVSFIQQTRSMAVGGLETPPPSPRPTARSVVPGDMAASNNGTHNATVQAATASLFIHLILHNVVDKINRAAEERAIKGGDRAVDKRNKRL